VDTKFDVFLVLISIVNLKLYKLWFAVGCRLSAVRLEKCPACRLKHDWSFCVVCEGWGLMAV